MRVFQPWTMTDTLEKDDRWTVDELAKELPALFDCVAHRVERRSPGGSTEPRR